MEKVVTVTPGTAAKLSPWVEQAVDCSPSPGFNQGDKCVQWEEISGNGGSLDSQALSLSESERLSPAIKVVLSRPIPV